MSFLGQSTFHPSRKMPQKPRMLNDPHQMQSPFFSELPLEIRREIYEYSLPACKTIAVEDKEVPLRIRCIPWAVGDKENTQLHDWEWHAPTRISSRYKWSQRDNAPLSIYLVCWKMYHESAEVLYATKIFHFDMPITLVRFHRIVPPQHFSQIRNVEMIFCSSYAAPVSEVNAQTFKRFLSILGQLPRLQNLHIMLPQRCWRDLFYYPGRRLEASGEYVREHGELYWRRFAEYGWKDVEPYLEWVKELACRTGVIVVLVLDRQVSPRKRTVRTFTRLRLKDGFWVACTSVETSRGKVA